LKRIAIVSEDISRPVDEGFKKATVRLGTALRKMVGQAVVFTRRPGSAALDAEPLPGNKLLWGPAFSRRLAGFDPEAILYIPEAAATPMSIFRAASLRMQSGGRPVVLMSLQRRTYPGFLKPLLKSLRPELVLVLSSLGLDLIRDIGCKAERVTLGVDSQVFTPPGPGAKQKLRAKYGLPSGRIILHVGHISPGRNLGFLSSIADENTRVLVVSSTATRRHPDVMALIRSRSVILMDNYIEHIEEIYRVVDAYIFPTFSATDAIDIPLSVLEAMATNLPIAATDFGGLPDLFAPGEGLFICSTENQLLEACRRMRELDTIATRDKVLGLSWEHAAETVIEAIGVGLK
jgi:glycosyltransferase involved in cell wall biosynthesis